MTAPGGETLDYAWNGVLPLGATWSGPVAGVVSRTFDDDSLVTGVTPASGPLWC